MIELPEVSPPPGQADLYSSEQTTSIPDAGGDVTARDIEFDYSEHLDRIVTALERLAINTTIIANNTTTISNAVVNPITRQKTTNFTGSINDTVLTVSATSGENVLPGMIISGQDITPNTKIVSQISGSGKEGTYIVDTAQTISNRQITGTVTLTSEGIAYSLGQAEQHHLKMKELASGIGIRNVTPYDTFSLISIYHLLVEQGKVLDTEGIVDPDKQKQAISKILEFNNILKTFREF
jgi:hypothetical protein